MIEIQKKRPIGVTILGVLFIIAGIFGFMQSVNTLNMLVTKDQQVKIMEDQLLQAEKSQDFKPSELQKDFVRTFKERKITISDYFFQVLSLLNDIGLILGAIFLFTLRRWTTLYITWYFIITWLVQIMDNFFFTFINPIPRPSAIQFSGQQKVFILIQQAFVTLLIACFIIWYFNRKNIKDYFWNKNQS